MVVLLILEDSDKVREAAENNYMCSFNDTHNNQTDVKLAKVVVAKGSGSD